jgi:endonuclease/exonuclease/phosphatase family metal-dependent hydrolase
MRIVTWNIRGGKGMDGVRSLGRIVEALRDLDADIVCLQEVHRFLPGGAMEDQPAGLAKALGARVAYSSALRLSKRFGLAILSRWPIERIEVHRLPNDRERRSRPGLWLERRICQEAVISSPEGPLTVLNTHWSLSADDRMEASKTISGLIRACAGPLLLCGDLNARPDALEVARLLSEGLTDSGAGRNQMTYPADRATARIDYIWCRGISATNISTPELSGSDHLPILIDASFETQ